MRLPLTQNCPKYCMGKVSRIPTIGDYTIFFNSLFFVLYSGIGGKQRQLQQVLENKEKRRILQKLTQIGGVQRYKNELRLALAEA